MSYRHEWKPSPNYTPGPQTQAFYGRPRQILFGAGHWWGDPAVQYSHDGVVNTFLNPARQASAHAVVSAGRVTEMVRAEDTAWCTNNANPYVYAIELRQQASAEDRETCSEWIADKGLAFVEWKPHKTWYPTACNPIDWGAIMRRAQEIWRAKHAPVDPEWKRNLKAITPVTMYARDDSTPLRNLASVTQVIKNFNKGTPFEIAAETRVNGYRYLLTRYAYENNTGQGFDEYELEVPAPAPVVPEWQKNLVDIEDVKLMVLVPQTQIVNLNTGQAISPLGQGTWIDFAKKTTVGGKVYLISNYSVANALPNGILMNDVGLPVPEPPVEDKPEWLKNWQDIEDVEMYTRTDAPVINLLTGETTTTIARGTKVAIASATEWHGQRMLITKYSTDKKLPHGISVNDLDMKPVEAEPDPVEPTVPTDQLIKEIHSIVKWIKEAVAKILAKLGIN